MIFGVALEVFRQLRDPAGQKCDLHIRAAGIFFVELELLVTRRFVAFCHNEGANVDEDRVLATHALKRPRGGICVIRMPHLFRVCHRTKDSVSRATEPCGARRRS